MKERFRLEEEPKREGMLKSALMALLRYIFEGRGDDPLSLIKADTLAAHLRAHAESMPYDHYSHELMAMAELSEEDADLLGKEITAMGAGLPQVSAIESAEGTLWEKLAKDLEELSTLYHGYLSQAGSDADDDLKKLLHRLREDKHRQRTKIQGLLSGLHGYSL
jgi:hypothetical protein